MIDIVAGQLFTAVEGFLNDHKIWIDFSVAIGALLFGGWQIKINSRLKSLQDFVSVAAVPGNGTIKLLNTGKVNLYLWRIKMPDRIINLDKPRLITSGTGDTSYYWIEPPSYKYFEDRKSVDRELNFEFELFLEDDFGARWISEHGGSAWLDQSNSVAQLQAGSSVHLTVWSHKTYKRAWKSN